MAARAMRPRPRGRLGRGVLLVDDFMSWFLYGRETWLVALLKGVPFFLFVYFLVAYLPNYAYYLVTTTIPFLRFSDEVGFLVAATVGGGNFVLIIVMALLIQASRGRIGPGWTFLRLFVFLNYAFVALLLIPLLVFNLAGGSFVPMRFPPAGILLGTVVAGMGAAGLLYLYLEYQRITRQDAREAESASARYAAR
jgi:hypothetical protein